MHTNSPGDLGVICASPIVSAALQHWLESGPVGLRCHLLDPNREGLSPLATLSMLMIVPMHWREMGHWLPGLRAQFLSLPWLVIADLRLAGMFSSLLTTQLCALVALGSSPQELWNALRMLCERQAGLSPALLLGRTCHDVPPLPDGEPGSPITISEFQCGCAASLGLSNPQIAEALHRQEATVKTHIHHLLRKLQIQNREALACYFERALSAGCDSVVGP